MPTDVEKVEYMEKPEEETLESLKVCSIGQKACEFDVSNYTLVCELKTMFLDEIGQSDFDMEH